MPTVAAPAYLVAAASGAAVVVALHLLAWRRPAPRPLPTARFAPASSARAVSRAVQLRDVLLLLVRAALLLVAGLAMAAPDWTPRRAGVARILLLDASRRVADVAEVADSARRVAAGAATLVRVRTDSVARLLPDSALGERAEVRGTLAAGLVLALREATRLQRTHERVEIVVISPFAAESWDPAMEAVRARWDAPVRVVRVAPRTDSAAAMAAAAATRGHAPIPTSDPLGAAVALALGADGGAARGVRVVREAPTAADSAVARAGAVLVVWPAVARADVALADVALAARTLLAGDRAVIGRLAPGATLDTASGGARVVARWGDGSAAAVERALGRGCVREVSVTLPAVGDLALSPAFRGVLRAVAAPCGGGSAALVEDARLAAWAKGDSAAMAGDRARDAASGATPDEDAGTARPWLLLLAALLLVLEWWLRRVRPDAASPASSRGRDAREAA